MPFVNVCTDDKPADQRAYTDVSGISTYCVSVDVCLRARRLRAFSSVLSPGDGNVPSQLQERASYQLLYHTWFSLA